MTLPCTFVGTAFLPFARRPHLPDCQVAIDENISFSSLFILATLCAAVTLSASAQESATNSSTDANPPYKIQILTLLGAPAAEDIVARMTLEEKVSQLGHTADAVERLGIPEYNWWNEGLHGVARAGVATVFPQAIGLAATFDDALLFQDADAISTEFRAKYNATKGKDGSTAWYKGLTVWSPNINIFRDPRWGRGQETYGEDPYLTSRMGLAFVKGLQGDDPKYLKTVATPKHFAVHSGPEATRHEVDVTVSRHDMEDTYLPAFRATIMDGHAQSVMCAYNSINGEPACANKVLLTDHLRNAWKFDGYVVSDCAAIEDVSAHHKFKPTQEEGVSASLAAGTDLICGSPQTRTKLERDAALNAVRTNVLAESVIDTAVTRTLTARFRLGMFDPLLVALWPSDHPVMSDQKLRAALSADEYVTSLRDAVTACLKAAQEAAAAYKRGPTTAGGNERPEVEGPPEILIPDGVARADARAG